MKEKDEIEILFPEAKVGDITVKPWSFGVLFDISDLLDEVITKVEEKEIKIDEDVISYVTMVKIFTIASKQVLRIISITLDKEEDEVRKLPMEDGVKIAVIIAKQNWTVLKNALAQMLPELKDLEIKNEEETETK